MSRLSKQSTLTRTDSLPCGAVRQNLHGRPITSRYRHAHRNDFETIDRGSNYSVHASPRAPTLATYRRPLVPDADICNRQKFDSDVPLRTRCHCLRPFQSGVLLRATRPEPPRHRLPQAQCLCSPRSYTDQTTIELRWDLPQDRLLSPGT